MNHPDDIKADELGGWKNDGQHSQWVKVKLHEGRISGIEFCGGKPNNSPHVYCLQKAYFVHRSSSNCKRKIIYLSGMYVHMLLCVCLPVCLCVYICVCVCAYINLILLFITRLQRKSSQPYTSPVCDIFRR